MAEHGVMQQFILQIQLISQHFHIIIGFFERINRSDSPHKIKSIKKLFF
jgi:hypothetical protein